MSRRGRT
jgi:hypothetical protein